MGALVGLMLGTGLLLIWRRGPLRFESAHRSQQVGARRAELLRQAGLPQVSPTALACAQAGAAVVAGILTLTISSTLAFAVIAAVAAAWLPPTLVKRLRRQRQGELRDRWPDVVDDLASAVRAGLPLPAAVAALANTGPVPLRPAFTRFASAYRASGRFGLCLDALQSELADPVGDRVCETLRVAREVGGHDLGTVLRTLSEFLRSDSRTRSELETRQGVVVNGARVAVAAPWLVLLLLSTQSSTVQAYDSPSGVVVLAIGSAACLLAYRVMIRIGRLPEPIRVSSR